MMTTIGPVVHEARQRTEGWMIFLSSTLAAAALTGAALGRLGALLAARSELLVATIIVCAAYAVWFVYSGRVLTTQWPPQMPRHWRNPRHPLGSVAHYGFVMGLTYATPIRAASVVPLALVVLALGKAWLGLELFVLLALVRVAPIVASELGPAAHERRVEALQTIVRQRPVVSRIDLAVVLVALGVVARAAF